VAHRIRPSGLPANPIGDPARHPDIAAATPSSPVTPTRRLPCSSPRLPPLPSCSPMAWSMWSTRWCCRP